jgi:hypothetical protein
MRRLLLLAAFATVGLSNVGCFLPAYSPDPNERVVELTNQSENLRQFYGEWERFWMLNHPSNLTYEHINGATGP